MKFPPLNKEEIFVGACLQFLIYFLIHWWVLLIMPICGLLWALGGASGGNKLFRRVGDPGVICLVTFIKYHQPLIFIAVPFMVWLAPSYGEDTKLFKFFLNLTKDRDKADLLTRGTTYGIYWAVFMIALVLTSLL